MKRQIAKIVGEGKIELVEEEIALGPREVLLEHICVAPSIGTHLHIYRGKHKHVQRGYSPEYPLSLYGSGAGRIVDMGAEVKGVSKGDLVTCTDLSDFSVVDADDVSALVPVPEGLAPEEASFLFQARIALRGVRRANIFLGDTVLVVGQGGIGIFSSQFAKLGGAWRVITADIWQKRLDISRLFGADFTINAKQEDLADRVLEMTGGKGADVVIDVSGSPKAFKAEARACRHLGKLVVTGWFVEPFEINLADDFSPKGLEVFVCHGAFYVGDWKQYQKSKSRTPLPQLLREESEYILDLMKAKRLRVAEMVTHRFPLEKVSEAFELTDKKPGECLGVLVTMSDL